MAQPYRKYHPSIPRNTSSPKRLGRWKATIFILLGVIVLLIPVLWIGEKQQPGPGDNGTETNAPTFDITQFSLEDPASPWVVVNKKRPLNPKTYVPAALVAPNISLKGGKNSESMQLVPAAATALETLVAGAKADGMQLMLVSAYRSHDTQKSIYDSEVKGFGQVQADRESARPGHSEHQTGWAADLAGTDKKCEIELCFAGTNEGKWLAANAHKYGFIIRYPGGKESITGYQYEPWHLRYVGVELATEMHAQNVQTLEEFFGLPVAPNY